MTPIRVEMAHWDGFWELSDFGSTSTERFKPQFEQMMDREWPNVTWNDNDGATLRLPFCRATERPGNTTFTIGMKRTYADGRLPSDALCARVHVAHANKGYTVEIEELGGALMRLLYADVLRLLAWLSPAIEAELSRCEALLATITPDEMNEQRLIHLYNDPGKTIEECAAQMSISRAEFNRRAAVAIEQGKIKPRKPRKADE